MADNWLIVLGSDVAFWLVHSQIVDEIENKSRSQPQ
jgi:hypothetical protein